MFLKPFVVLNAFLVAVSVALSSSLLASQGSSVIRQLSSISGIPKNGLTISNDVFPSSTSSSVSSTPSLDPEAIVINMTDSVVTIYRDSDLDVLFLNAQAVKEKVIAGFPLLVDTTTSDTWVINQTCINSCAVRSFFDFLTDVVDDQKYVQFQGSDLELEMISVSKNDIQLSLGVVQFDLAEIGIAYTIPDFLVNASYSGAYGFSSLDDSFVELLYSSGVISKRLILLLVIDDDADVVWDNSSTKAPYPLGGLLSYGELFQIGDRFNNYTLTIGVEDNGAETWSFNTAIEVSLNKDSNRTTVLQSGLAVIDSLESGISMPLKDADQFHLHLFGIDYATDNYGTYMFPCNTTGTLYFEVAHQSETLFLPVPISSIMGDAAQDKYLHNYCYLKVKGLTGGNQTTWNLGCSFLSNYQIDFDFDNKQMGFTNNPFKSYYLLQNSTGDSSESYSTLATASQMLVTKTYVESGSSTSTVGVSNTMVSNKTSNGAPVAQRGFLFLWILLMLF